jgi:hypothetical protein
VANFWLCAAVSGVSGPAPPDIIRDMTPPDRAEVKGKAQYPLRLPPALYERLQTIAADQGVSVNTLMVVLLAGGINFKLDHKQPWVMR